MLDTDEILEATMSLIADEVRVDYKPFRQRVPFGSTVAEFDASEVDLRTPRVTVIFDSGEPLPTCFIRTIRCGDGSVEIRAELIRVGSDKAEYAIEMAKD